MGDVSYSRSSGVGGSVRREQIQPKPGRHRDSEANRTGNQQCHGTAGPSNAPSARILLGAEVRAHSGRQSSADAERQRDKHQLQPRTKAEACQRFRAVAADDAGDHHNRDSNNNRDNNVIRTYNMYKAKIVKTS